MKEYKDKFWWTLPTVVLLLIVLLLHYVVMPYFKELEEQELERQHIKNVLDMYDKKKENSK